MWILKHSEDLPEKTHDHTVFFFRNKLSFDLSTLYTAMPQDKMKSRLKGLIRKSHASSRNYIVLRFKFKFQAGI